MKTNVVIVAQQSLNPAQKEEMWQVYKSYYHYSKSYFMERTERNTHFSLYLQNGKIGGFTGLRINRMKLNGKRKFLIYFGQTVITYGLRGQSLIPTTGIKLIGKYWRELMTSDAWFWLDALSYKAYLVPAKSLRYFYPSAKEEMPKTAMELRDFVGEKYYQGNYCPQSGTVRKNTNVLNDATVRIYNQDLTDPDIAFFAQTNPKHVDGHGLLTFAPINRTNIGKLVQRSLLKQFIKKTKRRRPILVRPQAQPI